MTGRQFFFDRAAVLKAADKQTRAVLSKFGAFVRRTAKGLIRKAKKPAPPGKPPHGHGQQLLKKFIFFSYEPSRRSVIIGPAKLNGMVGNAPEALEKGKRSKIVTRRRGRRIVKTATIRARPYMGPAAAKEQTKLPALWANSVKG